MMSILRSLLAQLKKPKVIRSSRPAVHFWWHLLRHCWVHFAPILTIAAVAGLHFRGYYIGDKFIDPSGATQELITFSLYIAAKLLELLITASLALTIRDIVRYVLMQSLEGLPLGLLTAEVSFTQIKYFLSLQFWRAVMGLPKKRQRFLITIWVIASGFIVAIAGPTASFLIVPKWRPVWPAGAAFFSVTGNSSTLFPLTLNHRFTGGPECREPSVEDLRVPRSLGCPWAGYPTLLSMYTQWGNAMHLNPEEPISLYEWHTPRQIIQHTRGSPGTTESWAMGTQQAINAWSGSLHMAWRDAVYQARWPSPGMNFKRSNGNTTVHIYDAKLAAVRSVCHNANASQIATNLTFPLLHPFKSWSGIGFFTLPNDYLPNNFNDPDLGAQWIQVPTVEVLASDGTNVKAHGSTLLALQVPQGPNSIPASIMTCTIDARWAPGEITTSGQYLTPVLDRNHLRSHGEDTAAFLPKDDGSWSSVSLHREWLDTLTPFFEVNGRNRSTLTALFEAIGLINNTTPVLKAEWIDRIYNTAASAIATLVVDGMSRIGVDAQVGNPVIERSRADPSDHWAFLSGTAKNVLYTYPSVPGVDPADQTKLTWYVTIPGLWYKADSATGVLSLTLLFAYCVMVLIHVAWLLYKQGFSEAWASTEELIFLAKNSPPQAGPESLADTCGCIENSGAWKKLARIRVLQDQEPRGDEEELHLLIDEEELGYTQVEPNREYGRRRN